MSDWEALKKFTQARIGIGRTGYAVPTRAHLQFQLDHARARDAIFWKWEREAFQKKLKKEEIRHVFLTTGVTTRSDYLKRPDLGRVLSEASHLELKKKYGKKTTAKNEFDVALIVSNGLSSSAVNSHGGPFILLLLKELREFGLKISPVFLLENARVAVSDEIGALTHAKLSIIVLGERPGLSSFDSLAVYLTYAPKVGGSDARRNCVSNIRPPDGLSYEVGVKKTLFLVKESLRRQLSGVELKEEVNLLG
jgi:ethanolamine ammonia-lyase small subunit